MAEVYDTGNGGLLDFIGDIYDCAVEPGRWPAILERTSKLLRGYAAVITAHGPARNLFRVEARWNTDEEFERAMIAHASISPAMQAIWSLGVNQPFTTAAFFGEDEFRISPWCKKVLRPVRCRDVAIAPLAKSAGEFSALMITRRTKLGPFTSTDVEIFRSLSPHFRRAVTIAKLLNYKSLAEHCRYDAPGPISTGIILTDATGRIVHTNRAAERMLDGCALLCIEDKLSARHSESDAALRAAITHAGKVRTAFSREAASLLVKGHGVGGLAISVLPLHRGKPLGGVPPSARVAVLVQEAGRENSSTQRGPSSGSEFPPRMPAPVFAWATRLEMTQIRNDTDVVAIKSGATAKCSRRPGPD